MSIFSKIKHALQHVGHDIEKAAKAVAHGVEHVAGAIENDIKKVLQDALAMTEALMQGNMKLAMQDLLKTGEDVGKTVTDVETATTEAALQGLQSLNLGKGFNKMVGAVEKGVDTVKNDVNKGIDSAAEGFVSSVEGVVSGTVNAAKDLAQGKFGAMMGDLATVGEDALEVASDLTPEGLAANVAASTLAAAHIGSAALDGAIAGAMHGGVGAVIKSVSEMEVGQGAQKLATKALGSTDAGTLTTLGSGAVMLASMAPSRSGGRRSAAGAHETPSEKIKEPNPEEEHKGGDEKTSGKADGKSGEATDKKQAKQDSQQPGQQAGEVPDTLDTLLLGYLADSRQRAA